MLLLLWDTPVSILRYYKDQVGGVPASVDGGRTWGEMASLCTKCLAELQSESKVCSQCGTEQGATIAMGTGTGTASEAGSGTGSVEGSVKPRAFDRIDTSFRTS